MAYPAGAVLKSPATDLTGRVTASIRENAPIDPILSDAGLFLYIQAYVGERDPSDSLISPAYAEMSGFPPLLVQVGTNEMLYGQCKALVESARHAGVDATLQEFQGMVHTWQLMDIPEAHDAFEKIGESVRDLLKS
jgi:monoterpene epsilon-lactone hydrolase